MTKRTQIIRAGMVGLGMIFEETYRPFFEQVRTEKLYSPDFGIVDVQLVAVASRTGRRAERYRESIGDFKSFSGPNAVQDLVKEDLDVVCIATPDNCHTEPAKIALRAGKHISIEKPSVLTLQDLDELEKYTERNQVCAKVIYHKLFDPDHKKLRTLVAEGVLKHVNNGYCSLLEPKQISLSQFAEWIRGRNPATYVAVHYFKLIDFTFGVGANNPWKLSRISSTGQKGLVGTIKGDTWDSVQTQIVYEHNDGREAAFDIHTSWVMPDNFPGYVEQEVQFRFDNGVWNAHQRKRGVELTVEDKTPIELKITPNYHYNGRYIEPWGSRSQRGYGIEAIQQFFKEIAYIKFGKYPTKKQERIKKIKKMSYNDISADRNCIAIIQAVESILADQVQGYTSSIVTTNQVNDSLILHRINSGKGIELYNKRV